MAFINWNDSYLLGVLSIDNQHKKIADIINRLDDAMKSGRGREILEQILFELVDFIDTHFKAEEEYMVRFGYNDYEDHRYEHESLTDEVKRFYDDFKIGMISLNTEIMNFLRNWLMDHIFVKDKKFAKFLQSQGIV